MMWLTAREIILIFLGWLQIVVAIVNTSNNTARMVISVEKPNERGPRTWQAGVTCLERFSNIYLKEREKLNRAPNLVLSSLTNMTTPAARIQEGFLKVMMEAISEVPPTHMLYQLRIISDSQSYMHIPKPTRELLLADYYIFIVDTLERLKNLMENYVSRMSSWNPGAKFIVLYNNAGNRDKENATAREIFEEMLNNFYVHRVAVMYATTATNYSVLLMDYYNVASCRQLVVKRFASCDKGAFAPSNVALLGFQLQMFLNSVSLSNCTFYMCASISAPFVEADCIHGLELHIIDFVRNRLKFHIEKTCVNENRGVEEESGNWTGLLGRLNERSCDFIMGGFYPDNDVIKSFWASDTYFDDSYTWFVKLADPRPPWMALYAIFDGLTWLSCAAVLLLTWLIWYVLVNLLPEPLPSRECSLVGLNNLAVTISVSANERPICTASRIFFIFLALYAVLLGSTYTSKLITVLADPGFLHQIDSMREVKELGIPYGGKVESHDWFENEDDMWIFDGYNDTSDFEPTTENLLHVRLGHRVLLSSRMYILQNRLADTLYAFPYNIFTTPMQMIMKPGFPFLYEFNWMIRHMRDYGILTKIQDDFVFIHTYLNRIARMRPDFIEEEVVLTLEHLQGSFEILIVGIIISTIFFVGELLTFHIIQPLWRKYKGSPLPSDRMFEKQLNMKKKKRNHIKKKEKLRRNHARGDIEKKNEILVSWNDRGAIDGIPLQQGIRFTPLKRRIIRNRTNVTESDVDGVKRFFK